jgi:hypothetical protein
MPHRNLEPRPPSAADILRKFSDPAQPITTAHFRRLIFKALHDAFNAGHQATVGVDEVATMHHFSTILDDIDAYNAAQAAAMIDDIRRQGGAVS